MKLISTLRTKLKYAFLDESKIDRGEREKILIICENILKQLKDLNIKFKGINLFDIMRGRLMGHNINMSSAVIALSLNKNWFKRKIFLLLFYLNCFLHYGTNKYKQNRDNYEINLIDYKSQKFEDCKQEKIDIAFECSDPSYIKTLIEIFEGLEERKKKFLIILPKKAEFWGAIDKLKSYKHSSIVFIEQFFEGQIKDEFYEDIKKFKKIYRKKYGEIRKIISVGSQSILPYARCAVKHTFTRFIPQSIAYLKIAEKIFDTYQPKILIGAKLRRYVENSFFYMAKKQNIKSMCVFPFPMTFDLESHYDQGVFHLFDKIFVLDASQKHLIETLTETKSEIYAYGNPQWDKLFDDSKKGDIRAKLNLEVAEKFIVIATQPTWPIKNVKNIIKIASSLKLKSIIKIHPREKKKSYETLKNVMIMNDKDVELYYLLKEANALITSHSTVALEAHLMGTPAILYNEYFFKTPAIEHMMKNFKEKGIISMYNKKELKTGLRLSLEKKQKNTHCINNHKKISCKIIETILSAI